MEQTLYRTHHAGSDLWSDHCEVCGRLVAQPAQDPWSWLGEGMRPLAEGLRQAFAPPSWAPSYGSVGTQSPWMPWMPPTPGPVWQRAYGHGHRAHHHGHDCGPCRPDPCHCSCCVTDADLVIYARLGERRIIPLQVSNQWRRDREVTLALSEFATSGGRKPLAVEAAILPETQFVLGPCDERSVFLEVLLPLRTPGDDQELSAPDVDDCTVVYARLSTEGCESCPARIALAVLPRDCAPYRVRCECACCC